MGGSSARLIELPGRQQKQQRVLVVLLCVGCNWCHDVGTEMTSEDEMCVYCQDIPRNFPTRSMTSGSWNVPIFESEKKLINNRWVYVECETASTSPNGTGGELSSKVICWNRTRKCQTGALKVKYCPWHAMHGRDLFTPTVVKLTRVLEMFQFPNFCSLSDQKISRRLERWMQCTIWWINYFLWHHYSNLTMVN